jgi:hypothetical protein
VRFDAEETFSTAPVTNDRRRGVASNPLFPDEQTSVGRREQEWLMTSG